MIPWGQGQRAFVCTGESNRWVMEVRLNISGKEERIPGTVFIIIDSLTV